MTDTFQLKGPVTGADCHAATCTETVGYDAQDRVVYRDSGHGADRYNLVSLDTIGSVVIDATSVTTTRAYSGQKLTSETVAGTTTRSFYDSQGNLDCTTASAYTGTTCPAAGNTHLKVDYLYDYRNRLVGMRTYGAIL